MHARNLGIYLAIVAGRDVKSAILAVGSEGTIFTRGITAYARTHLCLPVAHED